MNKLKAFSVLLILPLTFIFAQDETAEVEEVVVVGSQIKGAKITGALPVSVITAEDIESLAIESGEELFQELAENGNNNFNQTDFSGGYNASRGDVGSLDLRNIGTGNTVTLLNGRRLIQSPGYTTEWVGGSYVPVNSVNSNTIPVYGAERVEILRDGAAAIYGADAVSGVINTVLQDDIDGARVRLRTNWYDSFDAKDNKVSIQWGKDFDNGTNVSVYFDRYDRERIRAIEDPKWSNDDLRVLLPDPDEGGLGAYNTDTFRNGNPRSVWAQFYSGTGSSSNRGNIHTLYPASNSRCDGSYSFVSQKSGNTINWSRNGFYYMPGYENVFCMYDSGSIVERANYGDTYDKRGPLMRNNLVVFVNSELANGIEAYSEISYYKSDINRVLYPSAHLGLGSGAKNGAGTQPFLVPGTNYWANQFRRGAGSYSAAGGSSIYDWEQNADSDGSPNYFIENEADYFWVRYHRFQTPRSYDAARETWRIVQGFRGTFNDWDWDSGVVISEASSEMDNHGRVALDLLDAALADDTPSAYNPFCAGIAPCNEEQVLTSIYRNNYTELMMIDFKMSNPNIFSLPAGDVGLLVGAEVRYESHEDLRDPQVDGTVVYSTVPEALNQSTFPYISNISNSSPSPNTYGERTVSSLFAEMQIPLAENLYSQLAVRAEDADDYGGNVVGKFAVGYEPNAYFKLRASVNTSHKAPNLIIVNEGLVVRSVSQEDALLTKALQDHYDALNSDDDDENDQQTYPNYSMQRIAKGNLDLEAEESTNTSIGFVLTPTDNLVFTVDKWEIAQENTVGLFGERNHILYDTLLRLRGGPSECTGNPNVIRYDYDDTSDDDVASSTYTGAWDDTILCKVGQVQQVNDTYLNLDDRTIKGTDYVVQYGVETAYGSFTAKFMRVKFDEFTQEAGGVLAEVIAAGQPGGELDGLIASAGYGDLVGTFDKRAYPETKDSMRLSWKHKQWDALLSGSKVGSFVENSVMPTAKDSAGNYVCSGTPDDEGGFCGKPWTVDSMLTLNLTIGYKFNGGWRLRGSIRNLEDVRAPLADEQTFGYVADVHSDYGRSYSFELYKRF